MPKLGSASTTKLTLPSSAPEDPAWVAFKSEITLDDVGEVDDLSEAQATSVVLARLIKDWNFTEDGTAGSPKIPITPESVRQLQAKDTKFLAAHLKNQMTFAEGGLSQDENLTSTASSSEAVKTQPNTTEPNSQQTTTDTA